jgi:metallo-beta-lactamase class B
LQRNILRYIPSYAYSLTPQLAAKEKSIGPNHTFDKELSIKVGNETVQCFYFGEAHTRDNIVAWMPKEKVLFGGCMIKTMGAGKGNLADANEADWSTTVKKVKAKFHDVETVVPGHGDWGGAELLDYTIELFSKK